MTVKSVTALPGLIEYCVLAAVPAVGVIDVQRSPVCARAALHLQRENGSTA